MVDVKIPRTFKFGVSSYDGAFKRGDVAKLDPAPRKSYDKCWVLAYQRGAFSAYKYRRLTDTKAMLIPYHLRGKAILGDAKSMNVVGILISPNKKPLV